MEDRITALEDRMDSVESKIDKIVANTETLVNINDSVNTVFGIVKRHGPKVISFGAGIMTVLGVGNPHLWEFIGHFQW